MLLQKWSFRREYWCYVNFGYILHQIYGHQIYGHGSYIAWSNRFLTSRVFHFDFLLTNVRLSRGARPDCQILRMFFISVITVIFSHMKSRLPSSLFLNTDEMLIYDEYRKNRNPSKADYRRKKTLKFSTGGSDSPEYLRFSKLDSCSTRTYCTAHCSRHWQGFLKQHRSLLDVVVSQVFVHWYKCLRWFIRIIYEDMIGFAW